MRLLLTRPQGASEELARDLAVRGCESMIEPLLEIKIPDGLRLDIDGVAALALTSANGVRAFAARSDQRSLSVYAVGDSTARAARAEGFVDVQSAAGDVDDLAELLIKSMSPGAGTILHPAASRVAGHLARQLKDAGFIYRREIIYEAVPAIGFSPAAFAALDNGDIDGVVLMSPRTGLVFKELLLAAGLSERAAGMSAYCLSAAVAESVKDLPWQKIQIAVQPSQGSLLDILALG